MSSKTFAFCLLPSAPSHASAYEAKAAYKARKIEWI